MPGILGAMHLLAPMPEHADHRLDFLFHLWGPRVVHARCEANFQPVYVDLKKFQALLLHCGGPNVLGESCTFSVLISSYFYVLVN